MRVAYVCTDPGVPVFGNKGCSVHVQSILKAMLSRGFQVELFAARLGGAPTGELASVRVHLLEPPPKPAFDVARREQVLLAGNRRLRLELERQPPYDLVYERYALWSHAAMQFAADADVPSLLEVNAPLLREQARHRELVDFDAARESTSVAMRAARRVSVVSQAVARHVAKFTASGKVVVVPNGVNTGTFLAARETVLARAARRVHDGSDCCTIGFTGTLRPWHGMDVLGEAFRQFYESHSRARLLVVGDGPAKEQLLDHLGPAARATLVTGKLPHERVPDYLSQVDIAVAPYPALNDFYFSPLKVFEYMACGLPIVASRIGDLPKYIEDRRSARLVAPGDATAFAEAFAEFVEHPEFGYLMGRRAASAADDRFTWDRVLDRVLDFSGEGPAVESTMRYVG